MGIVPVEKGQKLTAQAWNQLATTVNNIAGGSTAAASAGKVVQVTIKNNTSAAVQAGNILTVYRAGTVRLAGYSPDEARIAWMNNGFQLDGYASGANGVPALLIDGIDEGGIGRALVYGLCAGFVTVSGSVPDTVRFNPASATFAAAGSGETADWKIIAASSVSSGKAFCYMIPLGGGGGAISFVLANGTTAVKDTVRADGTYIKLQSVTGHPTYVNIVGAKWTLNGPSSVVTSVSCDSNGDLVVNTQAISLTKTL